MKIGILTYHSVVNDGSVLQAYCLQMVLRDRFPNHEIEIINYIPFSSFWTEMKKTLKKSPPFYRVNALRKKRSISNFQRKYLKLSSSRCISNSLYLSSRFLKKMNYDVIFVGSDTVWEARDSKFAPPAPNLYYLPYLKGIRKFGFATSADPIQPDFLENKALSGDLAKILAEFEYVSARDAATISYLKDLGLWDVKFMPDPTLQYDFSNLVEASDLSCSKKIAAISYGGPLKSAFVDYLHSQDYAVLDFSTMCLDGTLLPDLLESVNKRLGIFEKLDLMITDRFHGSIFTFKLGSCPVVFVESSKKWPLSNSKGRDLFERLGLNHLVVRDDLDRLDESFFQNLHKDWNDVQRTIRLMLKELELIGRKELETIEGLVNGN